MSENYMYSIFSLAVVSAEFLGYGYPKKSRRDYRYANQVTDTLYNSELALRTLKMSSSKLNFSLHLYSPNSTPYNSNRSHSISSPSSQTSAIFCGKSIYPLPILTHFSQYCLFYTFYIY